jgi:type IV pilus assembly protein PilV
MVRMNARRSPPRGVTLLEAVISLSILLVGIVGTLQLQIFASTSDESGRTHTQALQVGHELLAALQQLPIDDARLTPHWTTGSTPTEFGPLLEGMSGSITGTTFTAYSDSSPLAGVTLDSDFVAQSATDPLDPSLPRFQRRWRVWSVPGARGTVGSSLIAVSVAWREKGFTQLREAVLYGTVLSAAGVTTLSANAR